MGQLVLLVVAAAWAAVLVPPLLRSRIENRPNSSVSDFRNQLSSLQRTMPTRGVAMRSMGRPLVQSPLSRPAAAGRPGMPAHGRSHGGVGAAPPRLQPVDRRRPSQPVRYDAAPRVRSHAERVARPVDPRSALQRRRHNVLFVLVLTAASTLFLAATTKSDAMIWTAVGASVVLLGYVCLLGQLRQRELGPAPTPIVRQAAHREVDEIRRHLQPRPPVSERRAPGRRVDATRPPMVVRRPADGWSHAV